MVRPPANQTDCIWRIRTRGEFVIRTIGALLHLLRMLVKGCYLTIVVADYEAEEDDRILESDTTGQMLSRSQQWDNNIASKVADFTGTYEKQTYAFNLISRKRGMGEFRAEERLMIEQALFQEEKRAMLELRNEMDSREKAGLEAKMRMAAMAQAAQAQSQAQSACPS
ncbi:unnamed protein product [Rhodiola kirilowii]